MKSITKWIKLTSSNDSPVFISTDKIISVFIDSYYSKEFTCVEVVVGNVYEVKDSVDAVLAKIQDAQGEALNNRYGPTFYKLGTQD